MPQSCIYYRWSLCRRRNVLVRFVFHQFCSFNTNYSKNISNFPWSLTIHSVSNIFSSNEQVHGAWIRLCHFLIFVFCYVCKLLSLSASSETIWCILLPLQSNGARNRTASGPAILWAQRNVHVIWSCGICCKIPACFAILTTARSLHRLYVAPARHSILNGWYWIFSWCIIYPENFV